MSDNENEIQDKGLTAPRVTLADLEAEIEELRQAIEQGEGIFHEAGDVLFSAGNVARLAGADGEPAGQLSGRGEKPGCA